SPGSPSTIEATSSAPPAPPPTPATQRVVPRSRRDSAGPAAIRPQITVSIATGSHGFPVSPPTTPSAASVIGNPITTATPPRPARRTAASIPRCRSALTARLETCLDELWYRRHPRDRPEGSGRGGQRGVLVVGEVDVGGRGVALHLVHAGRA